MDMLSFQRTNPDGTTDNLSLKKEIAENLIRDYPNRFKRFEDTDDAIPIVDKVADGIPEVAEVKPKSNFIPKNKLSKKN